MLAIFATWAVPCLLAMQHAHIARVWTRQFSGRISGSDFHFFSWLMNIPRGLGYGLPWLLLFGFAGHIQFAEHSERHTVRGLSWGIILPFVGINLFPGALPRYTMPLLAPVCVLVAIVLCAERLDLPRVLRLQRPALLSLQLRLPATIAVLIACAMCVYAVASVPFLRQREKVRSIAHRIDAIVPSSAAIYAIDPQYQPYLFYVRAPLHYVNDVADVPSDARFVLAQPTVFAAVESSTHWLPRHALLVMPIKDYRERETALFAIE
jgi:4-amino-4-deoxy-L-arabinose transferase-like glycosyltransferase